MSNIQETRFDDSNTVPQRAVTAIEKRGFERDVIWSRWIWVAEFSAELFARFAALLVYRLKSPPRKRSVYVGNHRVQEKRLDHVRADETCVTPPRMNTTILSSL